MRPPADGGCVWPNASKIYSNSMHKSDTQEPCDDECVSVQGQLGRWYSLRYFRLAIQARCRGIVATCAWIIQHISRAAQRHDMQMVLYRQGMGANVAQMVSVSNDLNRHPRGVDGGIA